MGPLDGCHATSVCFCLTPWSVPVSAEAGGAFQDQQTGIDIIWVYHSGCPGDGAVPPRKQSHATLQKTGAAAAVIAAAAQRCLPLGTRTTILSPHCDGSILLTTEASDESLSALCSPHEHVHCEQRRGSDITVFSSLHQSDNTLWSVEQHRGTHRTLKWRKLKGRCRKCVHSMYRYWEEYSVPPKVTPRYSCSTSIRLKHITTMAQSKQNM